MYEKLINWSNDNYSHLPWRINRSLYTTLVSEIMLQQTNVSTVIKHFETFINKYPNIESLAKISEEQILIDWKGLGYYRRAKNLLKAAKEIEGKFNGEIPVNFDHLVAIHGIGEYTANAILSIGANKRALSIDANLERVLSRIYGVDGLKGPKLQKEVYKKFKMKEICSEIEDIGPRVFNEALMDLGRSICKARQASCELCFLNKKCVAFNSGKPLGYPQEKLDEVKVNKYFELNLIRIITEKNGKILVYKKNENEWLAGQYEVPTFSLSCENEELTQYPSIDEKCFFNLPSFKTSITKYKISNHVLFANQKELSQISKKTFEWKDLEGLNLSTGSLKALNLFKYTE